LRRLLFVIGLALFGALLLYGVVLVEAHVEMSQIAPELPRAAQLEAGAPGANAGPGPVRVRYVSSGTQRHASGSRGTFGGFLLEWADGRAFLIDVGMDREGAARFGRALEWALGAEPVEVHGSVSEQLGPAVQRVRGVAFTHLHYDHTAGMHELCAALGRSVPVFQTPDQMDRGNFGTEPGRGDIADSGCGRLRRLDAGSLVAIEGFPGLAAIALGGHTPGSTAYAAEVDGTRWILAGDVTNSMQEWVEDRPKELVYSLFIVPESRGRLSVLRSWLREMDRDPRTRVVVSHDLDAIEASGMAVFGASSD
jgi:glyoxylase-like metal-dependent hydrolase (beta-lactamase superfamily II)